jgi:hypothetical protein
MGSPLHAPPHASRGRGQARVVAGGSKLRPAASRGGLRAAPPSVLWTRHAHGSGPGACESRRPQILTNPLELTHCGLGRSADDGKTHAAVSMFLGHTDGVEGARAIRGVARTKAWAPTREGVDAPYQQHTAGASTPPQFFDARRRHLIH